MYIRESEAGFFKSKLCVNDSIHSAALRRAEEIVSTIENSTKDTIIGINAESVTPYSVSLTLRLTPDIAITKRLMLYMKSTLEEMLGLDGISVSAYERDFKGLYVEIPTLSEELLDIYRLIDNIDFKNARASSTIPLGVDSDANIIFSSLKELGNILVSSADDSRYVFFHSVILSLAERSTPDKIKFIIHTNECDALLKYDSTVYALSRATKEEESLYHTLSAIYDECVIRASRFEDYNVKCIEEYNDKMLSRGAAPLPEIVVIIDDIAHLSESKRLLSLIKKIFSRLNTLGIYFILGTASENAEKIERELRDMIISRISYKTQTMHESFALLESAGAEQLSRKNNILARVPWSFSLIKLASASVREDDISEMQRSNAGQSYNPRFLYTEELGRPDFVNEPSSADNGALLTDKDFIKCIGIVSEAEYIDRGTIEKKLKIGYKRSALFMDAMTRLGLLREDENMRGGMYVIKGAARKLFTKLKPQIKAERKTR